MTDVKICDGDIVVDSCGRTVMLDERESKFQQAVIRILARKGSFVYDRELGSELSAVSADDELAAGRAELEINEALAMLDNTYARVIDISDELTVEITIDGVSEQFSFVLENIS